jgi:hypothetical protein
VKRFRGCGFKVQENLEFGPGKLSAFPVLFFAARERLTQRPPMAVTSPRGKGGLGYRESSDYLRLRKRSEAILAAFLISLTLWTAGSGLAS